MICLKNLCLGYEYLEVDQISNIENDEKTQKPPYKIVEPQFGSD